MQLMKFLRQYNKRILAIVTAFILVSWLVGEPLRQLLQPDPSKTEMGTAFGATIRARDLVPAQNTTNILTLLGVPWQNLGRVAAASGDSIQIVHWYLLSREAQQSGIRATQRDIDEFFVRQRLTPEYIDLVRNRNGVSLGQIRAAVGEFLAIGRMAESAGGLVTPTEGQVRHYVKELFDKVNVRLATFKASEFADPSEAISDAELNSQFEQYRGVSAEENDLGYGYKWPRRVRVEYLSARVDDLLPTIQIADEEIRRYYRKNKDSREFTTFEFKTPTTAPGTTAPAQPQIVATQKSFSNAQEQIVKTLKERQAVGRIRDGMDRIAADLGQPWLDVPAGKDGYKPVPDRVRDPNYLSDAVERYKARLGIPLTFKRTELLTARTAESEPGIGTATTSGEGSDKLAFSEYIFRVPGFYDASKVGETHARLALFQTPFVPLTNVSPLTGQPYDRFLFRVVETAEPTVPQSLADVRSLVERDVRELHALRRAGERAREFYASARNVGVEGAYALATDLKDPKYKDAFQPRNPPPFARRVSLLETDQMEYMRNTVSGAATVTAPAVVGIDERSRELVDQCFEMAAPDWTSPALEVPPTTRPVASAPTSGPARKVRLIELPKLRMWVVVELMDSIPVRDDQYANQFYAEGRGRLSSQRMLAARVSWFNPANVERRTGFVRARTETGEEVVAQPIRPEPIAPTSDF